MSRQTGRDYTDWTNVYSHYCQLDTPTKSSSGRCFGGIHCQHGPKTGSCWSETQPILCSLVNRPSSSKHFIRNWMYGSWDQQTKAKGQAKRLKMPRLWEYYSRTSLRQTACRHVCSCSSPSGETGRRRSRSSRWSGRTRRRRRRRRRQCMWRMERYLVCTLSRGQLIKNLHMGILTKDSHPRGLSRIPLLIQRV